jgi:SAM-dependent methyltransferase
VAGYTTYDDIAWFYNRYWGGRFLERYEQVLRDLLTRRLAVGSQVMDLCCGSGQICRWLTEQGHRVTGVDGSREMLALAAENAPKARFLCRDARSFQIVEMFDGVLCSFSSINHCLTIKEMGEVFNNVYTAMKSGSVFVFDVATEDSYQEYWNTTLSVIGEDHVLAADLSYDSKRRLAGARIAAFRHEKRWVRRDVTVKQKAWSRSEVERRLASSFFRSVRSLDGRRDLKVSETGRLFFVCQK